MPVDHVPPSYVPTALGKTTLWAARGSGEARPGSTLGTLVASCVESVERLLHWRLARHVHAVIYASTTDARRALDRAVDPTFLMAPRHAADHAVIVAHSAALDPRNGDLLRMRRLLCHELAHVFAAERTGSLKRLGDGGQEMRIRPWVDEGFAVCVAALASEQPEALERALASRPPVAMTDDAIDHALNDLASPRRTDAFAAATARVWEAVARHGFPHVFGLLELEGRL